MRHFPVQLPLPSGWRTEEDLRRWRAEYDLSPTVPGPADLGAVPWDRCLCSDVERARVTAETVFPGPVEPVPLLFREPESAPFGTGRVRLPMRLWRVVFGLSWAMGHPSQRACRDDFQRRVSAAADLLEALPGNTMVVSHAGMMMFLSAELRRRGFTGLKLRLARHATLHTYTR
ncbi:MAG: hypothetical protein EOP86_09390 [Verrucomicrobiaceae bacterium]|nr:MAG: hypothetical protein EOP86_09390 [Verrucomicrobiaceae bacterium]